MFALFGVLVATFIPVLELILRFIYVNFLYKGGFKSGGRGEVFPYTFYEEALRTDNRTMLELYKEYKNDQRNAQHTRLQSTRLVIAIVVLIAGNIVLPKVGFSDSSVMVYFINLLGQGAWIVLFFVLLWCFFFLRETWSSSMEWPQIFYPPLADKIAAKKDNEKKEREEWEHKMSIEAEIRRRQYE